MNMPEKAMLLAAGRGTRLYPMTETVPKCMMPVAGKPLLEHTLCWLRDYGVNDFVINLHHLPEKVTKHFGDGERFGVNIAYTHESELLGTAGAVRNAAAYFRDAPFFVWYGDNLGKCRMDKLWATHRAGQVVATIALHWRENPTQSGIVGFDEEGRIRRFLEKPRAEEVFSNWVSAGILVVEPDVLEIIPANVASDFGRDIFPSLLAAEKKLTAYRMAEDEGPWWIDTPEDLRRVQQLFD